MFQKDGKNFKIHTEGLVVWIEGHIFYCSKCKLNYDYAILYEDYPEVYTCRICSSDTEVRQAGPRMGIRNPRDQDALNKMILDRLGGYGDEKDWL